MTQDADARSPRAVGRRVPYATMPAHVRAWIDAELGSPVVDAVGQVGGMSPGPASRLLLADGRRAFVKAVSDDPNPQTPELYRHESLVLGRLPHATFRPRLLGVLDDGEWVALLLEDVEGRHPDLDVPAEMDAVRQVVRTQAAELAGAASSIAVSGEDMAGKVRRWLARVVSADDAERAALPPWWSAREDEVLGRVQALAARLPTDAWCHFDVRDDNLLVRPDGRAVILDWGMSCAGPSWLDELLLDLHVVDSPAFDALLRARPAYADTDDLERDSTDLLLAFGSALAVMAEGPPPQGLPWINDFRRREARRVLAGVRRRLDA
jgi:hypothetical protein